VKIFFKFDKKCYICKKHKKIIENMKNLSTFKVKDNLFLVNQKIGNQEIDVKPTRLQTNFIFVVDVSGSMSGDLDYIRKQLKNKLPYDRGGYHIHYLVFWK
jgi:hypothetical protein